MMGDNINTAWRALFSAYVFVNVILRSLSLSFVLVLFGADWQYAIVYIVGSLLVTSFFLFGTVFLSLCVS